MLTSKRWSALILSIVIGLYLSSPVTDADLGWHLRYGEHFWREGQILTHNTFSWIMPEYKWANHSWLYDIIIAKLFSLGGFIFLSVTGAVIISLSAYVILHHLKDPIAAVPFITVMLVINKELLNTGIKSHYISLFLSVLTIHFLERYRIKPVRSGHFILPGLMMLWSNVHGQFILGICFIAMYTLAAFIRNKQVAWWISVFITSSLATLVNPWGYTLWTTTFAHSQRETTQFIFEWMPWEWHRPLMVLLCAYIIVMWIVMKKAKNVPLSTILTLTLLTLLALKARRFISLYMFISLPLLAMLWQPIRSLTINVAVLSFFLLTAFSSKLPILQQTWQTYCASYIQCSEGAALFLQKNPPLGKLFNAYSLGGHLIYRAPDIPVFIDGRMTLWQDNYGEYPFLTYYRIIHVLDNPTVWLAQQNIQYIILQPQFELAQYLEQQSWPKVYSDTQVAIFENPFYQPDSV